CCAPKTAKPADYVKVNFRPVAAGDPCASGYQIAYPSAHAAPGAHAAVGAPIAPKAAKASQGRTLLRRIHVLDAPK
ncbi:MAG TPA: hypothetical protein VFW13_00070, partial [Phenylobacterium sp.]|nr:hypothetical protein [Phenylobacterium sp.]